MHLPILVIGISDHSKDFVEDQGSKTLLVVSADRLDALGE